MLFSLNLRSALAAVFVVLGLVHGACLEAARDRLQRINLSTFRAEWGSSELEAQSHLDIGVEETTNTPRCQIISPPILASDTESLPEADQNWINDRLKWAPLDFYTQVKPAEQTKFSEQLGRPDFFFKGDDFNRNHSKDSHKFTRALAGSLKGSLVLSQKLISKDVLEVIVNFTRGAKLKYEGLMQARVFEVEKNGKPTGECDAGLFYCPKSKVENGVRVCDPTGWTHRILGINAVADENGFARDQAAKIFYTLKEHEKNDVFALVASTVGPDEDPQSKTTEIKPLTLISK